MKVVRRRQDPVRLNREGDQVLFHLARGCPLRCRFCSLLWTVPRRPHVEAFTNVEEILEAVAGAAEPGLRFVVGEATDALALEPELGSLSRAVLFFAERLAGVCTLEFLTRSAAVEPLLRLDPRGAVWFGSSLTPPSVASRWEPSAAPVADRLRALKRMTEAGYLPLVSLAPVFPWPGWEREYASLLDALPVEPLRVEVEGYWQKEMEYAVMESLGWDPSPLREGTVAHGPFRIPARHAEIRGFLEPELRRRFPRAELHFQPLPDPSFRYA